MSHSKITTITGQTFGSLDELIYGEDERGYLVTYARRGSTEIWTASRHYEGLAVAAHAAIWDCVERDTHAFACGVSTPWDEIGKPPSQAAAVADIRRQEHADEARRVEDEISETIRQLGVDDDDGAIFARMYVDAMRERGLEDVIDPDLADAADAPEPEDGEVLGTIGLDASEGFGYWPGEDDDMRQLARSRRRRSPSRSTRTLRTRKWTAELSCGGAPYTVQTSSSDTLKAQRESAIGLARAYIGDGVGSDAAVVLYKTTASGGTVRHSSVYVYRDEDGSIRVQR